MVQLGLVELMWPPNDVIANLCFVHDSTSPRWRDSDETNREFKNQAIVLIQMFWLGVQPFC